MKLTSILKQVGLKQTEIEVFLVCSQGFPKASEISKIVNSSRTNVYAILNSLISKGLIVEISSGKIKQFRAVSTSRIYDFVEQKQLELKGDSQKLNKALDLLDKQFAIKRRADVEFFNGIEEVSKFYISFHNKPGTKELKIITPFVRYAMVGDMIDKINIRIEEAYKKLGSKFIPSKVIVPDTEKSQSIIAFQSSKHPHYAKSHDFRLVDFEAIPLGAGLSICDYEVCLMSLTESETWAMRFLDKSVRDTFNAMFLALWNQGRKLK